MASSQIKVSLLDVPPVLDFIRSVGAVIDSIGRSDVTLSEVQSALGDAFDHLSQAVVQIPDDVQ